MSRRVTATIHIGALRNNLARIRILAPRSKVMAVVKADGYGHGLERVALSLRDADAFGVASIEDGMRIRRLGLANRIVVLSGIDEPGDLANMAMIGLEPVIHHESQLELLCTEWPQVKFGAAMNVWLKLDTGMHRLGFPADSCMRVIERAMALPGIGQLQLMTHFASSDLAGDPSTAAQMQRFAATCALVQSSSARSFAKSLANSAAILGFADAHADWVRCGGLLYGISVIAGKTGADHGFQSAMTLAARLIAINDVAAGEGVGYGHAWRASRRSRIGVLAVGYADGYPRAITAGTSVLLRGQRVPIVGRVSMDLTTIDLTDLPESAVGDVAVLWGRGLPVEEIAAAASTIGYEMTCGMTRRVTFLEDEN